MVLNWEQMRDMLSPWAYFLCIEYLVGEYGTEPIADREPRSGRHEAVCHGGKFRQKLTFDVVRLRRGRMAFVNSNLGRIFGVRVLITQAASMG